MYTEFLYMLSQILAAKLRSRNSTEENQTIETFINIENMYDNHSRSSDTQMFPTELLGKDREIRTR